MSGILFSDPRPQFDLADGTPASGGNVYFYVTGTSTPATTYSNADLDPGHANTNPVPLGSDGRTESPVYLDPAVIYRAVVKDADGNTIPGLDVDPIGGGDIAAAIAEHNADPDAHLDASESQRGMVELANDAEAIAKSATDRALTPANLAALDASTTFKGFAERATAAEIEAGTDDVRFADALTIQSLHATTAEITAAAAGDKHFIGPYEQSQLITKSSTDMSCTLPGGLTFKGGRRQSTTDAAETFTFGTPFANHCYGVILTRQVDEESATAEFHVSEATPPTTTGFTIDRDDDPDYHNGWFYFWSWGD